MAVPPTYRNGRNTTPGGIELPRPPLGNPLLAPKPAGILVGVISGELSRFSSFSQALLGVMGTLTEGSGLVWAKGVDVPGNCNELCRHLLKGSYSHLWVMGDDHTFEPDIVMRLLEHDADVIVPHCLKRYPPWPAVVYSHQNEDGDFVRADLPESGPVEIWAAGSAGMLISRQVVAALTDPWFQSKPGGAGLNEDLYFCEKVRGAGFRIMCDPAVPLGHIALHTVRPVWDDGSWHTQVDHDGRVAVTYRNDQVQQEPEAVPA